MTGTNSIIKLVSIKYLAVRLVIVFGLTYACIASDQSHLFCWFLLFSVCAKYPRLALGILVGVFSNSVYSIVSIDQFYFMRLLMLHLIAFLVFLQILKFLS